MVSYKLVNKYKKIKLMIVVSEDWYFWSHRLSLATSAINSGFDVTLLTKLNQLKKSIEEKGINVLDINFTRSSNTPFTDILNIIRLIRIYKKEKPDIIHNVSLKTILISSVSSLFISNTAIINAFTGLGYLFSSNKMKAKMIRLFVRSALKFILNKSNNWSVFQNPDDLNLLKELKIIDPNRSLIICGSGVDTNKFSYKRDTNTIPVVMLASRMLWDKGIGEFVEAAKIARINNIKAKFLLVGGIDKANPMAISHSKLEKWNSEGCIVWKGQCNNMPEVLSLASIVCLPSFYGEGLPKVLLEAAAIGRPLIATDAPGCREIVQNGENGFLVTVRDISSLYDAIITLIADKNLRDKMGKKSRLLVESHFSTDTVNSKMIQLYKSTQN